MYAAGMCVRGVTRMYFVPDKTKVNQNFFINKILQPIVEKDIPRLYPGEEKNVILHFDLASSHTTLAVYAYLKKKKVKYISKEDWPSNSPDLSPMDFSGNGTFKKAMFTRKPETIAGLQKIAREVWKEFPETTCYNTMKAWPGRVQKMLQNNGFQIENMKKWFGLFLVVENRFNKV